MWEYSPIFLFCYPVMSLRVIHCFSSDYKSALAFIDLGFHISIPGIVTFKNADVLKDVAYKIPLERMLLETDAPFLTPRNMRPKPKNGRNEPAFLPYVLRTIAEALEKSPEEVAKATTETASTFFQI